MRITHETESVMMAHISSISSTQDTILHTKTTGAAIDKPKEDPPFPFKFPTSGSDSKETNENEG